MYDFNTCLKTASLGSYPSFTYVPLSNQCYLNPTKIHLDDPDKFVDSEGSDYYKKLTSGPYGGDIYNYLMSDNLVSYTP